MGSSSNASTSTDPLFTKELPPPPESESSGSLATTPLADHQGHPAHVASSAHAGADADAADGAVITGAESFWPSVDTDDSDTPPDVAPGSPRSSKESFTLHPFEIQQWSWTWVRRLGYGLWSVLGVDLEPIPPQSEVPNCQFQVMNITDAWKFQLQFDFVHLRMLGELPPLSAIDSLYEHLAPGGWAEFTEWVQVLQCPNHSVEGSAFERWDRAYRRGKLQIRETGHVSVPLQRHVEEGRVPTSSRRKYAVPLNAWPNSKSLQRIGSMTATNYLSVIEILSRDLFVHVLGWTAQESDALISQVRTDLQEPNIHSFYTLYIRFSIPFPYQETLADRYKSLTVYAQKPRG
ncbi:hypothetical protein PG997_001780 [Apiospora hydei]|uniref:Uncharacterized protein n=1 Tax=Apiospora hydei TaxID=1337664 RepID=A0ABR1X7G1_9PEZI